MVKNKGHKNLKPINTLSTEEQKEMRIKGAAACNAEKKRKKDLKERVNIMMELLANENDVKSIKKFFPDMPEEVSNWEVATMALFKKARSGDAKAFEVLRDTAGHKPTTHIDSTSGGKAIKKEYVVVPESEVEKMQEHIDNAIGGDHGEVEQDNEEAEEG